VNSSQVLQRGHRFYKYYELFLGIIHLGFDNYRELGCQNDAGRNHPILA